VAFTLTKFAEYAKNMAEKAMESKLKSVDNDLLGRLLLAGEGFKVDRPTVHNVGWGNIYHVTETGDWSKIHEALGKLTLYSKQPEPNTDARSRLARFYLRPVDEQFHNLFCFSYTKRLPKPDKRKGKQPKCRLKTVVEKRTVMVCDNSND
jgi:hypothetical protein